MKKITTLLCLFVFSIVGMTSDVFAQDPQFTQIYSSPLYLNPAFAGNLDYDCRKLSASRFKTMVNYRAQYNGDFSTFYGTIDYKEKSGRLGIGSMIIQDRNGTVPLSSTQLALMGSYKVPIINDWQVHMGLQASFNYRSIDFGRLTFPDQYSQSGQTSTTNEPLLNGANISYIDFATGVLLFNDKMYVGGAAHHLNQPNQSLYSATERLPMKVAIHGGYKFTLKKSRGFGRARGPEKSITPTLHYKSQGNFQQLELGTFFNYDPIVLGTWYRGLPIIKSPAGGLNQESICVMAGTKVPSDYGLIKVGVSYDVPIGSKVNNLGNTFEVSLSYQLINEKCRKRIIYRKIPCPGL
jgi:type IX secretion system PorP/SprF family membrane protein